MLRRVTFLILPACLATLALAQPPPPPAPQPGPPPPPPGVAVVRDVVFGTGGGRPLHLDIAQPGTLPDQPMPVIVYVHGGAFMSGNHHGAQNYYFAVRGYFTANIEYRLSPEAKFPAQIEDCKAAIRYLRAHATEYRLDPDHIGVWGHSAGGHLVALLGTSGGVKELEGAGGNPDFSSAVQAVVDCFGPTDLLHLIGQPSKIDRTSPDCPEARLIGGAIADHPEEAKAASPITYVDAKDPPFLIFHGELDDTVPFNQSELLEAALQRAGGECTFVRVKNGGHGFGPKAEPNAWQIQTQIEAFFDKHLRGR